MTNYYSFATSIHSPLLSLSLSFSFHHRFSGGVPLRWSEMLPGQHTSYTGVTQVPQRHNGLYNNVEMSFGQRYNRIFLPCPR